MGVRFELLTQIIKLCMCMFVCVFKHNIFGEVLLKSPQFNFSLFFLMFGIY